MAYTTDFIGHIDIEPALNPAEVRYLTAFHRSRRWRRAGGPYDVPHDLAQEQPRPATRRAYHVPAEGQPNLWCDWVPCWDGCCLTYDGRERFAGVASWLTYLVDHFLRPGAHGARSSSAELGGFTFDHVLDGMVVGCRRDIKQLFAIVVAGNRVREEVLRPGDRRLRHLEPLPYERAADEARAARPERRERDAQVLTFTGPRPA